MKVRVVLSVAIVAIALVSVATGGVRVPPQTPQEHRRIGMFIGISKYADPAIPRLVVCDKDAEAMARVMKQFGRLDKAIVLLNEEASRAVIRYVVCHQLVDDTQAGDEIFIYWSGHRGRCTGKNDGLEGYFVPTDGRADNTETMLMDDTLVPGCSDFVTAALSSSSTRRTPSCRRRPAKGNLPCSHPARPANNVSNGRKGTLGTMTYFLVQKLEHSGGQVTVKEAFDALDKEVPRYVEAHFPGSRQAPVLIDETTIPTYLRP